MAEIPNALTDRLSGRKTLDEIYDALLNERCLSPAGIQRRAQVITLAADAEAKWRHGEEQGAAGGTREYSIAVTLIGAGYLNDRATKLLKKITYKQKRWWTFWRRY